MSGLDKENERHIINPRVTVIIPCHNHADMINDAITSVSMQDYRPIQAVVIDDGSTDNPEESIKGLAEKIEIPILFIKNESPTGPSAARNKGIEASWESSDVFMMLDADDLYLPNKVSKSVEKYMEDPEQIGIVYTDAIIKNINTKTEIHEFRQPFDRHALEMECIISNTPLVSKKAIHNVGGYDESMRTCEDWELWLRITEGFVAIHIPETLHIYHVTGKNSSDVVSQEVWMENWRKIHQKILERRNGVSN